MKNYIVVCFNDAYFSSDEIALMWSIATKNSEFNYRLLPYVWLIHTPQSVTEIVSIMRNSYISVNCVNVFNANITELSHLPNITYHKI